MLIRIGVLAITVLSLFGCRIIPFVSPFPFVSIDATQTTVNTNEELSERNSVEDGMDTMLCNSDIEDSIDEEQFDGEYDDIDIEARR